jgi:hypothetical protein
MRKAFFNGKITDLAMAVILIPMFMVGHVWASEANARISISVKDAQKTSQALQKISTENKIFATNFNEYTSSKKKKKSINIKYEVPEARILGFMAQIAVLGDVKSQSYQAKQSDFGNLELKEKMLEQYKSQLDKIIASGPGMQDMITQLNYKIQALEREISEYESRSEEGYEPKVVLDVQIKERGYDSENEEKSVTINLISFIIVLVALAIMSLSLGILMGWFIFKKNKNTASGNI